jgi:hypothetical protein
VVGQKHSIVFCPFHQITLLVVVRNEGDLLVMFHCDFFMNHANYPPSRSMAKTTILAEGATSG